MGHHLRRGEAAARAGQHGFKHDVHDEPRGRRSQLLLLALLLPFVFVVGHRVDVGYCSVSGLSTSACSTATAQPRKSATGTLSFRPSPRERHCQHRERRQAAFDLAVVDIGAVRPGIRSLRQTLLGASHWAHPRHKLNSAKGIRGRIAALLLGRLGFAESAAALAANTFVREMPAASASQINMGGHTMWL